MWEKVHAIDLWKMPLRSSQRCEDKIRDRYRKIFHKISNFPQLAAVRKEKTFSGSHRHRESRICVQCDLGNPRKTR